MSMYETDYMDVDLQILNNLFNQMFLTAIHAAG